MDSVSQRPCPSTQLLMPKCKISAHPFFCASPKAVECKRAQSRGWSLPVTDESDKQFPGGRTRDALGTKPPGANLRSRPSRRGRGQRALGRKQLCPRKETGSSRLQGGSRRWHGHERRDGRTVAILAQVVDVSCNVGGLGGSVVAVLSNTAQRQFRPLVVSMTVLAHVLDGMSMSRVWLSLMKVLCHRAVVSFSSMSRRRLQRSLHGGGSGAGEAWVKWPVMGIRILSGLQGAALRVVFWNPRVVLRFVRVAHSGTAVFFVLHIHRGCVVFFWRC